MAKKVDVTCGMPSGFRGLHPKSREQVLFAPGETQSVPSHVAEWLLADFQDCFSKGDSFEPPPRPSKSGDGDPENSGEESEEEGSEAGDETDDLSGYEEEEGEPEDEGGIEPVDKQ